MPIYLRTLFGLFESSTLKLAHGDILDYIKS